MVTRIVTVDDDLTLPAAVIVPAARIDASTTVESLLAATNAAQARAAIGADSNGVRTDTASQGLTDTQQGNARANIGLAAAPVEVIWTGSAWRIVGTAVNLSARPTAGPLILVGGSAADRPVWANQDGDIHLPAV